MEYDSVEAVRTSDHFPVKAVFNVRVDGISAEQRPPSQQSVGKGEETPSQNEEGVREGEQVQRGGRRRVLKKKESVESQVHLRLTPSVSVESRASSFSTTESSEGTDTGKDLRNIGEEDEGGVESGSHLSDRSTDVGVGTLGSEQDSKVCSIQ